MSGLVFLAAPGEPTAILYNALARRFRFDAVVLETPIPRSEFVRRRAKRLGWRTAIGQVLFQAGAVPLLRRVARARIAAIKREHGLDEAPIPPSLTRQVASANGRDTIELLRALAPRVVLINGTRILSRELLRSVNARFVNVHAGITPLYRGVHGGYWALVDRRPDACGVTIHLVDEGIDTGTILAQSCIAPSPDDSFVTYHYLQLAAALPELERVLTDLLEGRAHPLAAPAGPSQLRFHPTLAQYLWHRARHGVR
jgi:folate-dependent phosphoribosylglycinamide formyltransferase PurN